MYVFMFLETLIIHFVCRNIRRGFHPPQSVTHKLGNLILRPGYHDSILMVREQAFFFFFYCAKPASLPSIHLPSVSIDIAGWYPVRPKFTAPQTHYTSKQTSIPT